MEEYSMCNDCRHHIHDYCYMKNNCYYEPILSCEGCVDHKRENSKVLNAYIASGIVTIQMLLLKKYKIIIESR